MGLWDWLTGLAAVKILFRGTDTYYRKEREAEKREERRRAQESARAFYKAVGRQHAAELALEAYHGFKREFPAAEEKHLRQASFALYGFSDEEAQAIIAGGSPTVGTPVAGRAQGPLPGRPVTSMADETLWEET